MCCVFGGKYCMVCGDVWVFELGVGQFDVIDLLFLCVLVCQYWFVLCILVYFLLCYQCVVGQGIEVVVQFCVVVDWYDVIEQVVQYVVVVVGVMQLWCILQKVYGCFLLVEF